MQATNLCKYRGGRSRSKSSQKIINIFLFQFLALSITYFNKIRGVQTSGLLFLFWFLTMVCGLVQCRSEVQNLDKEQSYVDRYVTISFLIQYVATWFLLLLNCWADAEPNSSEYPKTDKVSSQSMI